MQTKDQLQSAYHGRAVSIAARIIVRTSLITFIVASNASGAPGQVETEAQITRLADIEPGAVAISSVAEPARCSFDKGRARVESSSEGAGEAVAAVLQTPSLGNPQLEAAVGVMQFVLAPFAAGYGAISASHRKLTTEELSEAEQHLMDAMQRMAEQDNLRRFVLQYTPEKTHRRLIELAQNGTRSAEPFTGSLETRVETLQLRRAPNSNRNYQLTIRTRARLVKAENDEVMAAHDYTYTSGEAMFIDWTRAGGLENVAQTGFRQIAEEIARDFFSPALEAPIFLGAGYRSSPGPVAQRVRLARRVGPDSLAIRYVDYRVTANGPFEVFPAAARAEVLIRGPKAKEAVSADSQTDAEWAMDGLENHRNFVVQAGGCVAAVPIGIWEQTVGAIRRKSREDLSEASGMMQSIVWKTPLQQDLADNIARALAPQTAQPVLLRKLPTTSGQEGPSGDLIRISTGPDLAFGGYGAQMRPETALQVRVTKVELCSEQGSKRRPSLSLEAEVTLLRTSDGQELCAWPVRYTSARERIAEWSAHHGARLEGELRQCSSQIAQAVVAQLVRGGYVAPGRIPSSAIAKN